MEDKAAEMVNEVPPNGERAAVKKVAKKAARVVAGVDLPRSQYLRAKTLKQKLNAVSSLHVAMMSRGFVCPCLGAGAAKTMASSIAVLRGIVAAVARARAGARRRQAAVPRPRQVAVPRRRQAAVPRQVSSLALPPASR